MHARAECEDEACAEECFNEGNEDGQDALIELLNCYDSEWDCAEEEDVCYSGSLDTMGDGIFAGDDSDWVVLHWISSIAFMPICGSDVPVCGAFRA